MDQLEQAFVSILERFPNLTTAGFDNVASSTFSVRRGVLCHEASLVEFKITIQWLAHVPKSATDFHDSYAIKHVVEDWCGSYISNGTMIAAALYSGFATERIAKSYNASIGIVSPRYWPIGHGKKYEALRKRYRNKVDVPAPRLAVNG